MTAKSPSSCGSTNSSMSPASAAASTTAAGPPSPGPDADGWQRTGVDEVRRGLYRIGKAHVARRLHDPAPIYHAFHGPSFLGTFPSADDAKAHCTRHEATPC